MSAKELVRQALDDVGLGDVLGILLQYAEDEAESLAYTRKAGDQGINRSDISAWKKMGNKVDRLSNEAAGLLE